MARKKKSKVIIEGNNAIQGSAMDKVLKGRTEYQFWQSKLRKLQNQLDAEAGIRRETVRKGQS